MEKKELVKYLKELEKEGPWNHYFCLDGDIQTIQKRNIPKSEGSNLAKWSRIQTIIKKNYFKDKTILDIGCSDGYFSLMTSKFANKVIGVDPDSSRIKKANFIKSYFKLENCNFINTDINNFNNQKFDIGLILGLLHRLPDPLIFLEKAANLCDELIIEYKYFKSNKDLAYYGGGQTKSNEFNKLNFIFSPNCLKSILKTHNFKVISSEKFKIINKLKFPRHLIHAKRV